MIKLAGVVAVHKCTTLGEYTIILFATVPIPHSLSRYRRIDAPILGTAKVQRGGCPAS